MNVAYFSVLLDLYNKAWHDCASWMLLAEVIPAYKLESFLAHKHITSEQLEAWHKQSAIRETLRSLALTGPAVEVLLERLKHAEPAATLSLTLLDRSTVGRHKLVGAVDDLVPVLIDITKEFWESYDNAAYWHRVGCEIMSVIENLLPYSGRAGME